MSIKQWRRVNELVRRIFLYYSCFVDNNIVWVLNYWSSWQSIHCHGNKKKFWFWMPVMWLIGTKPDAKVGCQSGNDSTGNALVIKIVKNSFVDNNIAWVLNYWSSWQSIHCHGNKKFLILNASYVTDWHKSWRQGWLPVRKWPWLLVSMVNDLLPWRPRNVMFKARSDQRGFPQSRNRK